MQISRNILNGLKINN